MGRRWELRDSALVQGDPGGLREVPNTLPSLATAGERLRSANEGHLAVAEAVETLQCRSGAGFIVHGDRAHRVDIDLAAHNDWGDLLPRPIREQLDVHHQPIGD